MSIKENIEHFRQKLDGTNAKLVAVSKTKPNEDLIEAYEAGQRDFGENKVQDLTRKSEELPKDINWHFIGHLQRNKVKYIAPFIHLIHAVDSERLLVEINKQAAKHNRIIECLLQVFIADEETKFGLSANEIKELVESDTLKELNNIRITGLMGMATNTNNLDQVRSEFAGLKQLFEDLKSNTSSANIEMKDLSMGMTGDFEIACEEGSTMVRIGSAIFGARNY